MNPRDYAYDIESYPNIFTLAVRHIETGRFRVFEISQRRNDIQDLCTFIGYLQSNNDRMVGFNNISYDYPVLHFILESMIRGIAPTAEDVYNKSIEIIFADSDFRFAHVVWAKDRFVEQLDLFKIHHFDNKAKSVGLKGLQFAMRTTSIEDLPFDPGTVIPVEAFDQLIQYNMHDVDETINFYHKSKGAIQFREELTTKYNRDFMNHNDTKIGKDYFVMELERHNPDACFEKADGKRRPRQTKRPVIHIADVIFPYVQFENEEFRNILNHLKAQHITETKGVFKDLHTVVNGLTFVFGTGGIHASVPPQTVCADDTYMIKDVDVTSYYPSLAIDNQLYPEHLGPLFYQIYGSLKEARIGYAKNTPENKMLKLALNGTYGASNDVYSPFYDPKFTMAITVNGQLLLCMLSEQLMKVPGLTMIQANTDGVTFKCPHMYTEHVDHICKWWQDLTKLSLEDVTYSRMFIRDVNNYIAEYEGGKLKCKGAYAVETEWHQDPSARIVPMAAKEHLVKGADIGTFIRSHMEPMDFMIRAKCRRSDNIVLCQDGTDYKQQNIVRFYASTVGDELFKLMPPLKDKIGLRRNAICKGTKVTVCNDVSKMQCNPIDFDYYIKETLKLTEPLRRG